MTSRLDDRTAANATRRTEDLLVAVGESSADAIYAKDAQFRMIYANSATLNVIGVAWTELEGREDHEWHSDPIEAARIRENDARVLAGESIRVEEQLTTPDGRARIFESRKSPLRDRDGAIIGIVGRTTDITERKRAEAARNLLMNEVDHRSRNVLMMVRAMLRSTRAENVEAYRAALDGRLGALARAQTALAARKWEGAQLDHVVSEELGALAPPFRWTAKGPPVLLPPEVVQPVSMALHELCTNALKYGALSSASGVIDVTWRVSHELEIEWRERGGPTASPPASGGFGTRLIQSLARQISGSVEFQWEEGGLRVLIRAALDAGRS